MPRKQKRRNKKYNPIKGELIKLRSVRLHARESNERAPDGSRYIDGLHDIADAFRIKKYAVPWLIHIQVECEAPDGTQYIEEREIETSSVHLNDLFELFNSTVDEAKSNVNPKHLRDVAWSARPVIKNI